MKQLTQEQLETIKQVYEDMQKQVLNPLELDKAFKLINSEDTNYLHNKRAKILAVNRFMQFQYESYLKIALLDDLFMEETEVEKVVEETMEKLKTTIPDNSVEVTTHAVPQDEVTTSPTKIVNTQKPKPRGRQKQTHKE